LPEQPDYSGESSGQPEPGSKSVLIPNDPLKRFVNIHGSVFEKLNAEGGSLYVYGKIEYLDIFNRTRTTGFCFVYRGYEFHVAGPKAYNYYK